jgi:hypothetical protein
LDDNFSFFLTLKISSCFLFHLPQQFKMLVHEHCHKREGADEQQDNGHERGQRLENREGQRVIFDGRQNSPVLDHRGQQTKHSQRNETQPENQGGIEFFRGMSDKPGLQKNIPIFGDPEAEADEDSEVEQAMGVRSTAPSALGAARWRALRLMVGIFH